MKQLIFTQRAKWSYAIAALVFVCGITLCILGDDRAGTWVGIAAFSVAFGVASANGHLTKRQPKE